MVGHRWWRNLAGAISVLGALLIVVFGLPALDRAVPINPDTAAAQRREVAGGVSVIPPAGALIAKTARPGPREGSILFLIGPARYVMAVAPFEGDLPTAHDRLKTKIQSMRGYQVTADEEPMVTESGLQGMTASFTAPGRTGRFAVFLVAGLVIEVTVTGSEADLAAALLRVDESIATIAHGEPE
jgi:hypothetical protein